MLIPIFTFQLRTVHIIKHVIYEAEEKYYRFDASVGNVGGTNCMCSRAAEPVIYCL